MFVALLAGTILVIGFALPYTADAALLTQQLDFGMTNPDVASLQTFLAQDPTIYPQGLVTSYFGLLTKAAVSNFQVRNGIAAVGRVGPITLLAINNQMGGYSDTTEGAGKVVHYGVPQPILSNINVLHMSNSATITWNSNVLATARVMYSTVWPFGYRNAPSITSSTGVSTTQSVTLSNLQSNTTYFYVVESLDSQGNFSWSRNGASFKTD
jgi:peptidoglycan hydrolase-like protein with peptidoglycan-binding domain